MLAALDWVMEELRVRGLRVVWVLADNWYPVGGIDGFVKMGNGGKHQDFFSNAQVSLPAELVVGRERGDALPPLFPHCLLVLPAVHRKI